MLSIVGEVLNVFVFVLFSFYQRGLHVSIVSYGVYVFVVAVVVVAVVRKPCTLMESNAELKVWYKSHIQR